MLGIYGKRILLTVHILLNAVWMGGLATILLLMSANEGAVSGDELATIDRMIFLVYDWVVMNVGFAVMVTGLLFSLFTRWGFFDFPWVFLKWTALLLIFAVITFFLSPAVNGMAALSDLRGVEAYRSPEYSDYRSLALGLTASLLMVLSLVVLVSVFKPWGPRKKPFRVGRKVVLASGITIGVLALGGGTTQFMMLQAYRSVEVHDIGLSGVTDGEYLGEAQLGVPYRVEVTVRQQRILGIRVLESSGNHYARLAEGVLERIVHEQTPAVRAVTGATTSSKGLMKAVENAVVPGTLQHPATGHEP